MLTRNFYLRDANIVARELLGKLLVHKTEEGTTSGIIVEVESYIGPEDKGSHAYLNKRTVRTEIQFGLGGYAYIYTIAYTGLHNGDMILINIVQYPAPSSCADSSRESGSPCI